MAAICSLSFSGASPVWHLFRINTTAELNESRSLPCLVVVALASSRCVMKLDMHGPHGNVATAAPAPAPSYSIAIHQHYARKVIVPSGA